MANTASNTRTIVRYAPKKKRRYSKPKTTIPLAIVAGFAPLGLDAYQAQRNWGLTDVNGTIATVCRDLTGFNPYTQTWIGESLQRGLYPILFGFALHYGAGKLGINRMLGRAGIPFIRI